MANDELLICPPINFDFLESSPKLSLWRWKQIPSSPNALIRSKFSIRHWEFLSEYRSQIPSTRSLLSQGWIPAMTWWKMYTFNTKLSYFSLLPVAAVRKLMVRDVDVGVSSHHAPNLFNGATKYYQALNSFPSRARSTKDQRLCKRFLG